MASGHDDIGLLSGSDMSNHSSLATRATRKTTRFSVRDAKYNAAGAMHRVAWALQDSKAIGQICEKPLENLWFCSGEDRTRTTHKFPGKLTLRHHARREIRRAPISLFVTTRNTIHRDQLATSLQPDLQGHEFKTDPNLQGHRFPFTGSFTGSHQKPLRIYRVTISIYRVTGLEFRLRFIQRFNSSPPCGEVDGLRATRKP